MAYQKSSRGNLYLDRHGHEGEWEPDRLDHLGNFLEKMGMISEVTSLPDNLFSGLNQAIVGSSFWTQDNSADSADMNNVGAGIYVSQTPAAEELNDALQDFFHQQGFPITIAVNSVDPEVQEEGASVKFPVGKGHKLYPNGIVVGGEQSIEGSKFVMFIHLAPVDETYNPSDVNPNVLASKIARIARHELVHSQQFEKRRRKQKTSRMAAKKKYEDEGQIPPEDAPRHQYLGSHIEVDAYAHEFAEELLDLLGKDKAMDVVRTRYSADALKKLGVSDTLVEYLDDYADDAFTKKLRGKIFSQMTDMINRGIYEGKNESTLISIAGVDVTVEVAQCDTSRRKGLMNRLSLDENSGMLFVFSDTENRSFWMKETYLPLSIAYLDEAGVIINIEKMTPLDLTSIKSSRPARYALEMNEGWFERNGVFIGDTINVLEKLQETKMSNRLLRDYISEMLRESFVSHSDEPEKGDSVVNNNPGCKHYGSEGVVLDVQALPGDAGKVIVYQVTNDGPAFHPGDILEKTMDQLVRQ